jgi:hypothetical protein
MGLIPCCLNHFRLCISYLGYKEKKNKTQNKGENYPFGRLFIETFGRLFIGIELIT